MKCRFDGFQLDDESEGLGICNDCAVAIQELVQELADDSFRGPPGPQGLTGPNGRDGYIGPTGERGADGFGVDIEARDAAAAAQAAIDQHNANHPLGI